MSKLQAQIIPSWTMLMCTLITHVAMQRGHACCPLLAPRSKGL